MQNIKVHKRLELAGHSAPIYGLCKAENKSEVFSCSGDKMVARWNLEKSVAEKFSAKLPETAYTIAFNKTLNILCAGLSTGHLIVIDLDAKKEKRNLAFHEKGIFDIRFSVDASRLWVAGGDGKISVWDTADFSLVKYFVLCEEKVRSITLNEDKNIIAAASGDGMISFINNRDLKIEQRFFAHKMAANKVVFHPGEKNWMVTGGKDAYIKVWDWQNAELIYDIAAHNYAVYDFAFNKAKTLMASASRDKTVKIWDAGNFEILKRIDCLGQKGHKYSVNTLLWNDDDILLSAGDDAKIMGWEVS